MYMYWRDVKPLVDSNDGYMYSRTCEVKSLCQFTHYGRRKRKNKEMSSGCIWLYHRPISQIPPCTCYIFYAPPCNRNVHICAHWWKNVVTEYLTYESWDLRYGSTVCSNQLTSVPSGEFLIWFIHYNLKWPKTQNKGSKVIQDWPL